MNILKKALEAVGITRRPLSLTDPEGWDVARGYAGEEVTDRTAMSLSAVWACTNLLSGTISSLPLMVYRAGADGSREVAKDHPLYRLLHDSPNFEQTSVDFWDYLCTSIELWGNGYARIVREGRDNRPTSLLPAPPNAMAVRRKEDGTLEYRWTENGRSFVRQDRDMLHVRGPGGHPLGGMSALQHGRQTFSTALAAERTAAGMFANGMRPSGVLTFENWLGEDKRRIAEEALTKKFLGAMNTGRPMILEGGTKWEALTISPEDAQMLETRGFSVEEICRFFGVPPFMIGHTEKSTSWGTGLEQQTLGFQKFTLRRRLKRIEQSLEKQLLTSGDKSRGVTIEFNVEGLLRADTKGRAKFYKEMTSIGAMTINEVRALENLPPVEGGGVPRMQMQNVPITEAGNETAE